MLIFAKEVINFLQESFKDGYTYHIEYDPCTNWENCLQLYVADSTFRIRINQIKMCYLYKLYKSGDNIWKEQLLELLDI